MADHEFPPPVDRLVETAMDTYRESDRLAALQAANYYDRIEYAGHGAEVVEGYLGQMGLQFSQPRSDVIGKRDRTHTPHEARLMQAVDMAIGGKLGVRSEFFERIGLKLRPNGTPTNVGAYVLSTTSEPEDKVIEAKISVTDERPFEVRQTFFNETAFFNFWLAMDAVRGTTNANIRGWSELHEDWRAAFAQVHNLDEVPFSRRPEH